MSWADEYWKGAKSQAGCMPPMGQKGFSPKKCQEKAHVTCGNWDAADHDLCGYFLKAAPDHYVNEEWFGVTSPRTCADAINALRPRKIFWTMRRMWTTGTLHRGHILKADEDEDDTAHHALSLFSDCNELLMGRCVELGDGGTSPWMIGWLLGAETRNSTTPLPCSGRGTCTTHWQECGAGTSNESATPCCSCHFGYAGAGCTELDVRVYVALGGASTLGVLLLAMIATSVLSALTVGGKELNERLLG